jgi:hypothetical protein
MQGLARLVFSDSGWIATPSGPGLGGDSPFEFAWWFDVPEAAVNSHPGMQEGTLVDVDVDVDVDVESLDAWTSLTPFGSLGSVSRLRPFRAASFRSPIGNRGRAGGQVVAPAALDAAVIQALERVPPEWPVYEVQGSRPEVSGWHTLVKTLRPVSGVARWRGAIDASMLRVQPWLIPREEN